MPRPNPTRRTDVALAGSRETRSLVATLGGVVRGARRQLGLAQARLAVRVGISRARLAEIERGDGAGAPLGTWIALGMALKRPLAVSFSRGIEAALRDAGHLAIQELVLKTAERHGWTRRFEVPTRPAMPAHSIDVLLRIDQLRLLVIVEVWNRLDDLGAAVRSTHRKMSEAAALAAAIGWDERHYSVAACWILRDSAASRDVVRRYPSVLRAEFRGSSRAWVEAFESGTRPPEGTGIFWADAQRGFLAMNLRRG